MLPIGRVQPARRQCMHLQMLTKQVAGHIQPTANTHTWTLPAYSCSASQPGTLYQGNTERYYLGQEQEGIIDGRNEQGVLTLET